MRPDTLRRRDAIAVLAGALGWPIAGRAQQPERVRRIGVLINLPADHPEAPARVAAFQEALQGRRWIIGDNVIIDYRWSEANSAQVLERYARELFSLALDVVVAAGRWSLVAESQSTTKKVPVVIVGPIDPTGTAGAGIVDSLPRPGGSVTGFSRIEPSFSTKWLELLTQIVPGIKRAAVLRDRIWIGERQLAAVRMAAPSLNVELTDVKFTDVEALERDISVFAREPNGGLVVTAGSWGQKIIELAAKYRLPAVYPNSAHVVRGGLISYGPSVIGEYRRGADYVDRILRGARPADLPVQMPTEFETVLNLKTAGALGLEVPIIVQARVNRVLE
jgi:putative tryptophan/tyrosine transport system substrate-binding protein